MHLNPEDKSRLGDGVTVVKEPPGPDRPAQRDPEVSATVSTMLLDIEQRGLDAVRDYAERLDNWSGTSDPPGNMVDTADEPGGRPRGVPLGASRGTSGLHRARWWLTATRGDPRDSATENRPPGTSVPGKGETVV